MSGSPTVIFRYDLQNRKTGYLRSTGERKWMFSRSEEGRFNLQVFQQQMKGTHVKNYAGEKGSFSSGWFGHTVSSRY